MHGLRNVEGSQLPSSLRSRQSKAAVSSECTLSTKIDIVVDLDEIRQVAVVEGELLDLLSWHPWEVVSETAYCTFLVKRKGREERFSGSNREVEKTGLAESTGKYNTRRMPS